jgi:hypothetical protein
MRAGFFSTILPGFMEREGVIQTDEWKHSIFIDQHRRLGVLELEQKVAKETKNNDALFTLR